MSVPSAGIMASSVVLATSTVILDDPLETTTNWGAPGTIVAALHGNGMQLSGTSISTYAIPAPYQGTAYTASFAWKTTTLATIRNIAQIRTGTTDPHVTMRANTDGSLSAILLGATGSVLGTSAPGLVTANTFYLLEFSVLISDTAGTFRIKVGGVTVVDLSGIDTRGTAAAADTFCLLNSSGGSTIFDDFLLTTP